MGLLARGLGLNLFVPFFNRDKMKLKVAGVPEHFNSPWKSACKSGLFNDLGVEIEFVEYPGGTGAMCNALEAGEVDIALLLTEGATARALNNNSKTQQAIQKFKICGIYVESPLLWGVHVGVNSHFNSLEDLKVTTKDKTPIFAISRYGSGSHLMSYVLMQEQTKQDSLELGFEVIKNLVGAKAALPENDRLVFMWEHFMTDPLVKQGVFKRIGDQPTPWPCFVVAVRDRVLDTAQKKAKFEKVLEIVKGECDKFKTGGVKTTDFLHQEFKIKKELAAKWLDSVTFSCESKVEVSTLLSVAKRLHGLERLNDEPNEASVRDIILTLSRL